MDYQNIDVAHLDLVDEKIIDRSEMARSERQLLNGLIRHHKPKKILELGVAAGASTAVMLNAIRDDADATLISIDFSTPYYRDPSLLTGFMVEEVVPELTDQWMCYTGEIAAWFMDRIGDGIDMCVIDTVHHNPGEFLDFLMVLPYLKKNAVIVVHDISYHALSGRDSGITCGVLYSALQGRKIIPPLYDDMLPNIGCAILDEHQDPWSYFHLLTLPWSKWNYLDEKRWAFLRTFFAQHYSADLLDYFDRIVAYKNIRLEGRTGPVDHKTMAGI
jgi:predicted O-methyltransferase YrrM